MTSKPSRTSADRHSDAWKEDFAALLAEMKKRLGPEEGARCAEEAFAAAHLGTFGAARPAGPRPATAGASARTGLKFDYGNIVGQSAPIVDVLRTLDRIASSDLPVLITGESGTGKELVARAIHQNGPRASRVFVRENCAAIPESLLESELFGYRRGAFTGATQDKRGLFEEGDGGCVFLDEIGEMSLGMQAKLMRVLQDGEIRPVGSSASITVDVRLISATNRDLRKLVAGGRFREDLFFRLNVVPIHLPPLRERPEDIPLLVDAFLASAARRTGQPEKRLDPAALDLLRQHSWPGNVRELENEIHRAFALSGGTIKASDLSPEARGSPTKKATKRTSAKPAKPH